MPWGDKVSPVSLALSIKKDAFFSHGSAMWKHGLGEDSKNIFINKEQSKKPQNSGDLTQRGHSSRIPEQTKAFKAYLQVSRRHNNSAQREAYRTKRDRTSYHPIRSTS
jgi:hypothetical protein